MLDESRIQTRPDGYRFASSGGIADKVLLEVAAAYQNRISAKMGSVDSRALDQRFSGDEKVLVSVKYDGEGVLVYFEAGRAPHVIFAFNSPSGRFRAGLACLQALADSLTAAGVKKALLRGELYLPGRAENHRFTVSDVIRVSSTGTPAEVAGLRLSLFDIIMVDGRDLRDTPDFTTLWDQLGTLAGPHSADALSCRAEGEVVPESSVPEWFARHTGAGLEGLVVRRLNRLELTKIKPKVTLDAAVVGYVEGDFEEKFGVLSLLVALSWPGGEPPEAWQVLVRVGTGFTDDMREELHRLLKPLQVAAPLAVTDSDGRTVHFVKPEFICEIEADDLIASSRRDREHTTPHLIWDAKTQAWTFRGMVPFPRPVFVSFSKLRPDKAITGGGARITQVLPEARSAPAVEAEGERQVEILRREVYTKEQKGEVMVRKLLVAKTAGGGESFPYVVTWTDFSAKRKDPLKVSTSCAQTPERATALAESYLAEGLAKGWNKAG